MVILRYPFLPLYFCILFRFQQRLFDINRIRHDRKRCVQYTVTPASITGTNIIQINQPLWMVILRYPILPSYHCLLFGFKQNLLDISRSRHDRKCYLQYTCTPASITGTPIIQNDLTLWMVILMYHILPL